MGFDMRSSNGRCQPLLLGGCILLCIVLVCNWWALSTQNYELIKHIDLEEQMRSCCGARDQCVSDRSRLETNAGQIIIQVGQQKAEIKRLDTDLTMCKSELESLKNLDASRTEMLNTLRTNLEEKKEEVKRLSQQITDLTAKKADNVKPGEAEKTNESKVVNDNKGDETGQAIEVKDKDEEEQPVDDITDHIDGERDMQMGNGL